ncbi:hypothetical protein BDQ12DRAFT_344428 [Crucibulum laeve]|uniref:Uncharacterized protein n=1 Tax=Crucibulum laeve TaxID=68775 RepID=A0A5C3M914_9AGAR|nr:hypothetical protein BDQ12DRAFT_344428 [Crucibulum laeve]
MKLIFVYIYSYYMHSTYNNYTRVNVMEMIRNKKRRRECNNTTLRNGIAVRLQMPYDDKRMTCR